ncbi:RHS repeat-associated core domain-containing protein [Pseudomonas sp. LAIL14HWK12:I10]|nr:RHS repeat-associated core domain-containing protein [Pseudomonas sp. LAIL14HWK12:I11]SMR77978.1 RHS repeat-associated core domain-containing protein [Pseudomonas sp. LAIL14HWK12:I10]SOD04265.1 RHS repeat-associated core domain-containing protein [Pseudomonas sp. LAIL14HWK12:I8]
MRTQRVQYLPGLELRSTTQGGTLIEQLQVVLVGEAGHAQVRALHWAAGKPPELADAQLRYSYADQLGSGCLEVDGSGAVISQEEYYPYGGTAVWAACSEVQGRYKFVRYSGKERDATGLYYYGYRYYQPWLGRWLSADPAGTVDGLNLYAMVRNNPMTLVDELGLMPKKNDDRNSSGAKDTRVVSRRGDADPAPVAPTTSSAEGSRDGAGAVALSSRPELPAADSPVEEEWETVPTRQGRQERKAEKKKESTGKEVNFKSEFAIPGKPLFERLARELPLNRQANMSSVKAIGQRINPDTGQRQVVFLDQGNKDEGLSHITSRHRAEFEAAGIEKGPGIISAVMTALIDGKMVGIQGAQTGRAGRPIYEFKFKGKNQILAVQLKDDGSVLGANTKAQGVSFREKEALALAQSRKR